MPVNPDGSMELDVQKIYGSFQKQISEQAAQIAIKDAMIEMLKEERVSLMQKIDEISEALPKTETKKGKNG